MDPLIGSMLPIQLSQLSAQLKSATMMMALKSLKAAFQTWMRPKEMSRTPPSTVLQSKNKGV